MALIPYPTKERVENKICLGSEHKEIKSSTNDKGNRQVDGNGTTPGTTPGID